MVMVVVFTGHDDLARLFGDLFQQLVFDVGKQACRIALIGAGIAAGVDGCGKALDGLSDVARLYVCGTNSHG